MPENVREFPEKFFYGHLRSFMDIFVEKNIYGHLRILSDIFVEKNIHGHLRIFSVIRVDVKNKGEHKSVLPFIFHINANYREYP